MSLQQWEHRLAGWATRKPETASAETEPSVLEVAQASPSSPSWLSSTPWLESIEQAAMACEFEVLLNQGQYQHGMEIARDALRIVHSLEDELSVYRPHSDFSNINRLAHQRPIACRFDVCQLLQVAKEVSRVTGRAFDITAGALSEVWGFSRRQGRKPSEEEIAAVLESVDSDAIVIDPDARTVHLTKPGIKLNPGGIGKGYALDRVAAGLVAGGLDDFLIHGGRSSVLARGNRYDGNGEPHGWWIALAHPLRWKKNWDGCVWSIEPWGPAGPASNFFIMKACGTAM